MAGSSNDRKREAIARMINIAGRWTGRTTLWMDPSQPALEGDFALTIEPIAGGTAILARYEGKHGDMDSIGALLLGYDRLKDEIHASWVDSFHTGDGPMILTGPARDGVVADVVGTYYWEQQPFGWRIEIRQASPDTIDWRMFNRMDREYPATACTFTRAT